MAHSHNSETDAAEMSAADTAPSSVGANGDDSALPHDSRAQNRRWLALALTSLAVITSLHYLTDVQAVEWHNIYRRLYYIPILLAAFSHGLPGGIGVALLASLLYMPHAFFLEHHHRSPSPTLDKALEIVLYLFVGGLTGWLVERQRRILRALERTLLERDALERKLVRTGKLRALGELVAGLTHEIRNPLASIMGSAEALAAEFDEGHRKHRLARILLREIDRLDGVVGDLLQFAKPSPPERREVDLVAVAEQVAALTDAQAERLGIELSIDAPHGSAIVDADAGQIEQVLLNLFLNAFQAIERADPQTRAVEVRARHRTIAGRDYHCLGVYDTGPGIPEALRERIFEPYFTTRDEGTGLGLSISSRIAEAHDGFLEIETADDGNIVWLCLPARPD